MSAFEDGRLYRVVARNFVAGVLERAGRVVEAPPILRRWLGARWERFDEHCSGRGWELEAVD